MYALNEDGLDSEDLVSPAGQEKPTSKLPGILARSMALLETAPWDEFTAERSLLASAAQQLGAARFHLAVLGQFKRGKSTLLNALLGEKLLPSSVVPVTSIPTFLTWGPEPRLKIVLEQGAVKEFHSDKTADLNSVLDQYVNEQNNPHNQRGVARVDVICPSPLLKKGLILIDTPGIGSTFQHNTEATLNFLSQCDGALFLISADPPITQVEIDFLRHVQTKVVRTLFIMNKIDYLSPDELAAAVAFFRNILREKVGLKEDPKVYCVSARQGLEARISGDAPRWVASGIAALEKRLLDFATREKAVAVELVVTRKAATALGDCLMRLRLKQRSFTLTLEDLEKKVALFNEKMEEMEQQRLMVHDLAAGERKRIAERLEEECARVVRTTLGELTRIIDEMLSAQTTAKDRESEIRDRIAEKIPAIFDSSLAGLTNLIDQQVKKTLSAHQQKATDLIEFIQRTAAELFEIPYTPQDRSWNLEITHEPYWVTERWDFPMFPGSSALTKHLLPGSMVQRQIKKRLQEDTESIILRNAGNLRWALLQSLNDTFRRFESDFDEQFTAMAEITAGVVKSINAQRKQKEVDTTSEVSRLASFEARVDQLNDELTAINSNLKGDAASCIVGIKSLERMA